MNPDFAEWLSSNEGIVVINRVNFDMLKALESAYRAGQRKGLEDAKAIVEGERERWKA